MRIDIKAAISQYIITKSANETATVAYMGDGTFLLFHNGAFVKPVFGNGKIAHEEALIILDLDITY